MPEQQPQNPAEQPKPSEPVTQSQVTPDESKLGDAGKAALQAERTARDAAKAQADAEKARADELERRVKEFEDEKLSDIDKATKRAAESETELSKLKLDNLRLAALAEHPVPKEYQRFVTGTDAASFLDSAKTLSELYNRAEGRAPKTPPVPESGSGSGAEGTGTSVSSGRDLFRNKHSQKS